LAATRERRAHHGYRKRATLEDASRIAYRELIRWMVADYSFDKWDAYMLLSQCGIVRLGNFVDPKYSVGAAIRKRILASS
jgi:amidase